MKKLFTAYRNLFITSLIFVGLLTAVFLAGCAAQKTSVDIMFVVDHANDNIFEKKIFNETVEISGRDPSIQTIIEQLNSEGKITVEYDDASQIKSINSYENITETKNSVSIYQWVARINDNDDIKGLWSEALIKEGDTVTFKYTIIDYEL